ncbi:MAG: YceI family protein [Candidatus Acidiferrum sp.]
MRISGWKSAGASAAGILGIGLLLSATATPPRPQAGAQSAAKEISLSVEAARSQVHWTVDSTLHTVHGTFTLKSGSIRVEPDSGKASGEIVVLATSGESGNSSRDEKMHNDVLEVGTYPDVIFRPSQVEGKFSSFGGSDLKVHGTFILHGSPHEIVVPVHAEMFVGNWKGSGKFDVPYIQWGLKNPSNFLLKVQPIVTVDIDLAGSWQAQK